MRGNRGFLASGASLNLSLLGDEPAFAGPSLRRKFPFPAQGGDRFGDWVVGPQFEPNCLHHSVSANRVFPALRRIGRFCGDFRPLISQILVSLGVHASRRRSKNSVPGGQPGLRGAQLFRVESERLKLPAPLSRWIAEALDADAAR